MEEFTEDYFRQNFYKLLERVENGESFIITSEYGNAVIQPYSRKMKINLEYDCFCNHDDAC